MFTIADCRPSGRRSRNSRRKGFRVELLEPRLLLAAQGVDQAQAEYVPGQILIGFEGDIPASFRTGGNDHALKLIGNRLPNAGLTNGKVLQHLPGVAGKSERLVTHWQLGPDTDVMETVQRLSGQPGITTAEPNYIVTAATNHTPVIPNDSRFDNLWGMHNTGQTGGLADADIDAPEAWGVTTGSGDIVVGVIDSGVNYNHSDLAANIWTNDAELAGQPGFDDDGNGYIDDIHGYDFANDDGDPNDDFGHGTHVAGTIGAVGDNGRGVVGVNWNVKIMPIKFLDNQGSGTTAAAIMAVDYAINMRQSGVNIVLTNNSWGGGGFSALLEDAIALSGVADMLFVASAGNSGGAVAYPAAYDLDNIVSVAATDHNDALASFSNRGAGVDLAAPGVEIESTRRKSYSSLDGTSMAAPHVSGAASLVWDLAGPDATYKQVREMLLTSVDPIPGLDVETGGRLNVFEAVKQVRLEVTGSTPAVGDVIVGDEPTEFHVVFSYPVDEGFDPSVLSVNEDMSAEMDLSLDKRTATFTYENSPITTEGPQTISLAAGAVTTSHNMYDQGLQAWSDIFYYDETPLEVKSTDPVYGATVLLPLTTLDVTFNQAIKTASLGTDDIVLSVGTVVSVEPLDVVAEPIDDPVLYEGARYTLEGVDSQGVLTYDIAEGAINDTDGNPIAAYSGSAEIDIDTVTFPFPFVAQSPAGSLIQRSAVSGVIGHAGDEDRFSIDVDGNQTISVVVRPEETFTGKVTLDDGTLPIWEATGSMPGAAAILQTIHVPAGGESYTITVSSGDSSDGAYSLEIVLNAAADEDDNHSPSTAQDLSEDSWIAFSSTSERSAVSGSLNSGILPITTENETGDGFLSKQNDLRGSWVDSGSAIWTINDGTGVSGRIGDRSGSGPLASTDDQDTYYFIASEGDVITANTTAFSVDIHDVFETQLDDSTDGSFTYTVETGGEFWVHVYGGKGDYTLTMDIESTSDLSASSERLDYYNFQASPGDTIRLAADTDASRSAVVLTLFETGETTPLMTSAPTDLLDAFIEYTVPPIATSNYTFEVTTGVGTPPEFDVDYGVALTKNLVLDLERNDLASPQSLDGDAEVVIGNIGHTDANVLWVGGTTEENWNDGTFNVTQVTLDLFPADLSAYDVIYVDSNAGIPSAFETEIRAFVNSGGGLVTENGGDEGAVDFSWVPNYSVADFAAIQQHSDDNRLTGFGRVHPVTAGMTDAKVSNWGIAGHNVFSAVAGMDVLLTDADGVANIVADDYGTGRLVYLGLDADGHVTKGEASRLIRQSARWAAAAKTPTDSDVYAIDLSVGDVIELSASPVGVAPANTLLPGIDLHTPTGTVAPGTAYTVLDNGLHFVEVISTNDQSGDYVLTTNVVSGPGFTVTPTNLVTSEVGASDTFTVVLNTQPTENVSITLTADTSEGSLSHSTLDFTTASGDGGWDQPQTVTVTGVDDGEIDGDIQYTIDISNTTGFGNYVGIDPPDVIVINWDNEVAAGVTLTDIAPPAMSVNSTVDVTITGSNFIVGVDVTFVGKRAPQTSNIVVVDAKTITATVSSHKKFGGAYDVVVTNPDGSSAQWNQQFTVNPVGSNSNRASQPTANSGLIEAVNTGAQDIVNDDVSEASDVGAAGVQLVVSVYGSNETELNNDSNVRNFLGATDDQGIYRSYRYKGLDPGDDRNEAHDLALSQYAWDPLEGLESSLDDDDDDGRPDLLLSVLF